MKQVPVGLLIGAIAVSLVAGGIVGFLLGVSSTEAGARFLEDLTEQEQHAETEAPKRLVRERFELEYPSNWTIDVDDEDYDPDHMFSIESPGAAFVMFVMGDMKTNPESSLQKQISAFSNLMGTPVIQPFGTYGGIQGKGATIKGKLMGVKITIKTFACFSEGMTAIIVQQCPDEDYRYVKDGLLLIEESFALKPKSSNVVPNKSDAGDGL